MSTRGDRAREELVGELWELTERAETDLARLDEPGAAADPARVQSLFRTAHTLKGLAGVYGLDDVAREAHALEDQLDDLRMERVRLDRNAVDRLLARVERVRAGLRSPTAEAPPTAVSARLDPALAARLTDYEQHRVARAVADGRAVYALRWEATLDDVDPTLDALRDALTAGEEHVATLSTARDDLTALRLEVLVASAATPESLARRTGRDVAAVVQGHGSARERVVSRGAEVPALFPTVEASLGVTSRGAAGAGPSAVRVDIARLDALLDVVSQLSALRATLAPPASRELGRRVAELREALLALRLVPLGQTFERLSREVRALAGALGRRVRFEVTGADTTLDKALAEEVVPALVHLVRNAVDHGVEDPDARAARGKPAEGRVRVDAWSSGSEVGIAVEDDGAGIDPDAVRSRARELGLEGDDDDAPTDPLGWLLRPGFTLRRAVTETSGRGVGLDAVRAAVARLGGVVSMQSRAGVGTRVTLTLPMTLAVQSCRALDVGGARYALPDAAVRAVIPRDGDRVTHDGRSLPVHDLAARFGEAAGAGALAVVVAREGRAAALAVDAVSSPDDVVVKPMPRSLRSVPGFAGVTDAGDGRLALVLDPGSLLASLDEARR